MNKKIIVSEIRKLQRQEHAILDHLKQHRHTVTNKAKHKQVLRLKLQINKLKELLVKEDNKTLMK